MNVRRARIRFAVWLAALAALALLAVGCGGGPAEKPSMTAAPAAGRPAGLSLKDGAFRYRIATDPPTLDPANSTDTTSGCLVLKIFDGLVEFEPLTMKVVPAVAESWDISEDGLRYTFHLRRGVKFHNGRVVTAEDFAYSFRRILSPDTRSERAWVLLPIRGAREFLERRATDLDGIRVVDSHTFEVTLAEPFTPFLDQLCMEAASAVPREEVERWGEQFRSHPVGCGPFRFVDWRPDVEVVLEAFADYYGGRPAIERVIFRVITSSTTAFEEYKAGGLDLLDQLPPGQIKAAQAAFGDEVLIWPFLSIYYFGFNHEKEPFKDNLKLRQAFNYAVDKAKICSAVMEDVSTPMKGILPPGVPGHDPELEGYPYDPERAAALLAEAGYPEGRGLEPITLWYNNDEQHKRICETVQSYLRRIGVTVELRSLEWATYLKSLDEGEPAFFRMGWVADYADPDNFLFILLDSSQAGAPGNYSRFSDPRFDALVRAARTTLDQPARIEMYREAQRIARDQACWLFLWYYQEVAMLKPWWEGLVLPIQGDFTIPIERLRMRPGYGQAS